jgi:hypothetical protein
MVCGISAYEGETDVMKQDFHLPETNFNDMTEYENVDANDDGQSWDDSGVLDEEGTGHQRHGEVDSPDVVQGVPGGEIVTSETSKPNDEQVEGFGGEEEITYGNQEISPDHPMDWMNAEDRGDQIVLSPEQEYERSRGMTEAD